MIQWFKNFSLQPISNGLLWFYFGLLWLVAPTQILSFDSYYYWEWSRHLDLSYYDGPPMIAYLIKIATWCFGDTLLALNSVGICGVAITAWIIFQTARLMLNREASLVAVMLWLFAPLNTLDLLKQTTYDVPYILFWALTVFCVAKFTQVPKQTSASVAWLYGTGMAVGCLMLSKYSGIVLVLALLGFVLVTPYSYLLRTLHFYGALGLSLVVFSPVLLWNAQHHWQSFLFQLSTHARQTQMAPGMAMLHALSNVILPALNFMLLPFVLQAKSLMDLRKTPIPGLCMIICGTFLGFYLLYAIHNRMVGNWMSPYLISAALLGGYGYQIHHYRKSTWALILGSALISTVIVLNNSPRIHFSIAKGYIYYQLMQQFNALYPKLPQYVFSSSWSDARMLFFLKDQPAVYTLDHCSTQQNEYAFWSQDFNHRVANKTIKEALYVDRVNQIACIKKYFDHCISLNPPTYQFKGQTYEIFAYKCTND